MKIITDDACTGYSRPGHPEKPARITNTVEKLRAQTELPIVWAKAAAADDAAILRAHAPELLASLSDTEEFDADTPAHPGIAGYAPATADAALNSLRCSRRVET